MLKQINNEQNEIQTIIESFVYVREAIEEDSLIEESHEHLKSVIKKILITNKEIPQHLAVVIAKTVLYAELIKELIDRKKRYKKYTLLKKVFDHITDKTAEKLQPATSEDNDNVSVDILRLAADVLDSIKARSDTRDDIQYTFDALFNKITTTTSERNRLSVMKLASKITQSNSDVKKRREIITQHLN